MKSLRQSLIFAALFALALPILGSPTQNPPPPPPAGQQKSQTPAITSRSEEVVVPVTVKSANGELITSLRKEDFRILEDNVEQRITRLSVEPVPISAVILLDDVLKKKPQDQLQESIRAIAGGFGPSDEVAIFQFDQFPVQKTEFISDPDRLLTELGRLQLSSGQTAKPDYSATAPPAPIGQPGTPSLPANPNVQLFGGNGTKSINDAVYAAAQLLRTRSHDRRRIIFLVSDGVESRGNKYTAPETVRMTQAAEVTVYSIGVGVSLADRIHTVLRTLAFETGGDIFYASSRADLERLYSRVADQARNQYSLYYSPDHKDHVVTYHTIDVRVKLQGLTVEARQGYFSAPTP